MSRSANQEQEQAMSVQRMMRRGSEEAFAERMRTHLTGAAVSMMTSIGHQTGLFDRMATLPPSTSLEIAAETGLQERYVREWLAAMASSPLDAAMFISLGTLVFGPLLGLAPEWGRC